MAGCDANSHSLSDARPEFTAINFTVNAKSLIVVMEKLTLLLTSGSEFASGKLIDAYKSQIQISFLVINKFCHCSVFLRS